MKSKSLIVRLIIGCIIFIISYFFIIMPEIKYDKNCLENYAITYCESQNLTYSITPMVGKMRFSCRTDERTRNDLVFWFTNKEVEECSRW